MTVANQNKNSIVIDLTYRCNAHCQYCQWGSVDSKGTDLELEEILLPKELLRSMKIERVVFSGGEPLLHMKFEEIVRYYVKMGITQRVLISNGLLISKQKFSKLLEYGFTGITISFDSIDSTIAKITRGMNEKQHKTIVQNIQMLSEYKRGNKSFEFGINTTLSKANIQDESIEQTIDFLNDLELDYVKFQPIFNDGYVENNAPILLFTTDDTNQIFTIDR